MMDTVLLSPNKRLTSFHSKDKNRGHQLIPQSAYDKSFSRVAQGPNTPSMGAEIAKDLGDWLPAFEKLATYDTASLPLQYCC